MPAVDALVTAIFGPRKARQMRYSAYIVEAQVKPEDMCFALFAMEHAHLSFDEIAAESYHAATDHDDLVSARFALAAVNLNMHMNVIDKAVRFRCVEFKDDADLAARFDDFERDLAQKKVELEVIILKLENKQAILDGAR